MYKHCLLLIWASIIACAPPENLSFRQIDIQSSDDIYDVVIDKSSNRTMVYSGYVWSRCVEVALSSNNDIIRRDTIADKALFDIYTDANGTQLGVGTDGYLYSKNINDQKWNFHRLSHWDILHKVVEKPNGYIATGGKAFETGYVYHINKQYAIDSVQYIGHEISDITNIAGDIWLTVGWGNIQRSVDGGKSWKILDIEGDLFLSVFFIDAEHGWIVGANGNLLKSIDAGNSWAKSKASPKGSGFDSFTKITKLHDGRLAILGTRGRLWLSPDQGANWQDLGLDTSSDLLGIVHTAGGKYIIHGTKGFLAEVDL